jgi:hypothetical protein
MTPAPAPHTNLGATLCYLQVLRVLEDDRFDLVLTPQYFTNVEPYADAFNHLNPQFWQYILPGLTHLGYVACTGVCGLVGRCPVLGCSNTTAAAVHLLLALH